MILKAGALVAVLLAGCAAGGAQADAAPSLETIAFEINSWGRPIDRWEVRADGTARHVKRVSEEGRPFGSYRLEHRAFAVERSQFARLAALAAELPRPRPEIRQCGLRATDLPYGTLRLTSAGAEETIGFDTGCQDAPYRAFVGQLRAMDALVTGWAEAHPPARVEEVGR